MRYYPHIIMGRCILHGNCEFLGIVKDLIKKTRIKAEIYSRQKRANYIGTGAVHSLYTVITAKEADRHGMDRSNQGGSQLY